MTPTEQDDELTKSIARLMYKLVEDHESSIGTATGHNALVAAHITDFMQLITADRKRVALEARIDELERTMPHTDGMRHYNTVKRRIAELEKEVK